MTERAEGGGGSSAASWNFFANVMDGALFSLGLSFGSQQTILPVLVRDIGGGNIALGLIPVVWTLGFNAPQILIAPLARRTPVKKPLLLRTAMFQRIPWLMLAAAAFFLFGRVPSAVALPVFFVILGLAALGGSFNLPVWFDLVAKLTPVRRRGRLFGARSILGALLGAAGGWVAARILGAVESPVSFSILLALSFCAMMFSYLFLLTLREPPETPPVHPGRPAGEPRGFIAILRTDRNLRRFLVADALQISAGMGLAFFTVHGLKKFALPDSAAGIFTALMMGGTIAGSLIFGPLADRRGHRINLMAGAGATFLSALAALFAPDPVTYGIVFVCAALTITLGTISRLPLLAELSPDAERPSVVALANLVTSPFVFCGVAGGFIADAAGYEYVFGLAALFALSALLWLWFMVEEPRPAGAVHE